MVLLDFVWVNLMDLTIKNISVNIKHLQMAVTQPVLFSFDMVSVNILMLAKC